MRRTLEEYRRHIERFGPDGAMELAERDLEPEEFSALKLVVAERRKAEREQRLAAVRARAAEVGR